MSNKIRQAIESDYFELNELVKEVHKLHYKNRPDVYVDANTPLDKAHFIQLINDTKTKVSVVEDSSSKQLVAYSIVTIMTPRSIPILKASSFAYIDAFSVKKTSQKNGLGTLLFNHILEYAEAEAVSSIQLVVWEFNKDAIKFYEKMGLTTRNRRMELML
ncbi:GNAT family N-acetyltransferase [Clostridium manihotivorum]|uniref:N-acetyltransferase n=1 Tax=Clostridium manihotivorum TaxID=2320868 RepID=A0A3R5V898_9CLOT|nr:GNAT family N-acetyltransferase [Clostridium manihotivorum]QAA32441.1 N-acetyltransferase [Clostridium manihotivorum]